MTSRLLTQKDAAKLEARSFRTDKLDAKMSNNATAGMTVNSTLSATVEDAAVLLYDGMPKTFKTGLSMIAAHAASTNSTEGHGTGGQVDDGVINAAAAKMAA